MTASGFVLFTLGLLAELVFLYEGSPSNREAAASGVRSFVDRTMSAPRMVIGLLVVTAGLVIGLLELLKVGDKLVYIDSPLVGMIMIILGVFVFFAAIASPLFLPVVNEQTILLTQVLLLVNALWAGYQVDWLPLAFVAAVPALISLALVVWRWPFPAWAKALLYLWYLLSLMIVPFQDGQASFFRKLDFTWAEAGSFGMLFIFLIIHGLFAARFFLMASSMILPRNRDYIQQIMPRLFSDEQAPLLRFGLVALLIAGLLAANQALGLLDRAIAVSLGMLVGVQMMNQRLKPQINADKHR